MRRCARVERGVFPLPSQGRRREEVPVDLCFSDERRSRYWRRRGRLAENQFRGDVWAGDWAGSYAGGFSDERGIDSSADWRRRHDFRASVAKRFVRGGAVGSSVAGRFSDGWADGWRGRVENRFMAEPRGASIAAGRFSDGWADGWRGRFEKRFRAEPRGASFCRGRRFPKHLLRSAPVAEDLQQQGWRSKSSLAAGKTGSSALDTPDLPVLHGLGDGFCGDASDGKIPRLHYDVFKGVEADLIQDSIEQDSIEIESKIFRFVLLDSSLLQISQIKGNRSESISLDDEGFRWMHNILLECVSCRSFKHRQYTRFETSRDLKLAFERNRFGSFISFAELKEQGRTTLIIPEGFLGAGLRGFVECFSGFSSVFQEHLISDKNAELELTEDIIDFQEYGGRDFCDLDFSLSKILFENDLHHLGVTKELRQVSSTGAKTSVVPTSSAQSSGSNHTSPPSSPVASDIVLNEDGTLRLKGEYYWAQRNEILAASSNLSPKTEVAKKKEFLAESSNPSSNTEVAPQVNAQEVDTNDDADQSFTTVISKRNKKKLAVQSTAMQTRLQLRLKYSSLG